MARGTGDQDVGEAAWQPTAALARAAGVAVLGVGVALIAGRPAVLVLVAPLGVAAALMLMARPRRGPTAVAGLDHRVLREQQGTRSRLRLYGTEDVEYATRVVAPMPQIAVHPGAGTVSAPVHGDGEQPGLTLEVSPRRWGRQLTGPERVAMFSGWAGFRSGPVHQDGLQLTALPAAASIGHRAEAPQPIGLVGAHRSRRDGDGTEFSGIRGFQVGDRLRRINWRQSLRTGDLHVVTTRAEEDTAILILVDATVSVQAADPAAPSSLDLSVRAAGALAEQHIRLGDRVGLQVIGGRHQFAAPAPGDRHLRRLLGLLAQIEPRAEDASDDGVGGRIGLRTAEGATVAAFSPLLHPAVLTTAARSTRQGRPTLVVDTMPADQGITDRPADRDARIRNTAWRARLAERELAVELLAATGCPVVPWRGPGSLDLVLRQLSRSTSRPRPVAR